MSLAAASPAAVSQPEVRRAGRALLVHFGLAWVFLEAWFNGFAAWFVRQERFIYTWDLTNYWNKFGEMVRLLPTHPIALVRMVGASVLFGEYNDLAALPLIPVGLLFGTGRLAYVLAVVNVYAVPSVLLLWALLAAWLKQDLREAAFSLWLTAITAALFAPLWNPILFGFVDIGGWLFVLPALLLFVRVPPARQTRGQVIATGALLAFSVLFRRWYAYAAVGFFAAACVDWFPQGATAEEKRRSRRLFIGRMTATGIAALGVLVVFAAPITKVMLTTSYRDVYAYSRSTTLWLQIHMFVFVLGAIYLPGTAAGAFLTLRDRRTRRFAAFLVVQLLVILALFLRTQNFGNQHYYLVLPAILLFSLSALLRLFSRVPRRALRWGIAGLYLSILGLLFGTRLVRWAGGNYFWLGYGHAPLVRSDLPEIERLMRDLDALTARGEDEIYVLASSQVINFDTLYEAPRSLGVDRAVASRILPAHEVDERDGFPTEMFRARYLVVAKPVQYHADPCHQRVIGIPAAEMLNGGPMRESYRQLRSTYRLEEGVRLSVFERVAPVPQPVVSELMEHWRRPCP